MTKKQDIDEKLANVFCLAEQVTDKLGLKVVEVKFGQEGRRRTLTVTILRTGSPVSHRDCEQVSRQIESSLDELSTSGSPVIGGPYSLVVESPGISRVLKSERDFQIFAGQRVEVETKEKIAHLGTKFTGVLVGLLADRIKLAHPEILTRAKLTKKEMPREIADDDIEIDKSVITEIKLFAYDLIMR